MVLVYFVPPPPPPLRAGAKESQKKSIVKNKENDLTFRIPSQGVRLAQERKEEGGEVNPSARQLNDLMHKAMYTVNHILYNLEKEKGKRKIFILNNL